MIQNSSQANIPKIGLGTHLGSFSDEDSRLYTDAIIFAVKNGITMIDTAINYRGMRSEKDVGKAVSILISSDIIKREDVLISSKAGLLFGDIATLEEMISFALNGVDAINVGSKNVQHIQEILNIMI